MATTVKKTGQDLFDLLNQHKGEKYVFGAQVSKSDSKYKGPWDCAEFISWGIYQVTGELWGVRDKKANPKSADAYSGYFRIDSHDAKIVSLSEAAKTPGAIIVRNPSYDLTGHVVVSDGKGGTIEAHSTKDGVINSVISGRKWDIAYLIPSLDYSQTESKVIVEAPKTHVFRYIPSNMMVDGLINHIKEVLKERGYHIDYMNNTYDYQTMSSVRLFQIDNELLIDGEVGPQTAKALNISI